MAAPSVQAADSLGLEAVDPSGWEAVHDADPSGLVADP